MKRKFISVLLLAVLTITTIGGCKSNDGENVPTLKVYMFGSELEDKGMVIEKANEILAEKIGAKMDLIIMDAGAYTEKMNMKLASNEKFDICFTSNWLNPYEKGVNNGSYYPLTELINKNCPDLWDTMEDYWWDGVKYDNEIYAVPNQQIVGTLPAITMNTKWVEKYNLDVDSIKTIDDIEPFLENIKENEPNVYPYKADGVGAWLENGSIVSCVSIDESNTDELKAVFKWDEPGFEKGLKKMREWFLKGYIRKDQASCMDETNDWKANKYVVTGTGWKPGFEASQKANLGGEHIAICFEDYVEVTRGGVTGSMWAISRNTDYPDKAIQMINEFQTNVELYNLLCYGIEGQHYEWVDDTHIRQFEDSGYYMNRSWAYGNQFNAYLLEGQDDNTWEETKKINEEAKPSRLIGFVFDSSKVQMEISQCATVEGEFKNIFNGSADYTELLPKYKERMMQAGAQNILDEVQRQLDEYAKTLK